MSLKYGNFKIMKPNSLFTWKVSDIQASRAGEKRMGGSIPATSPSKMTSEMWPHMLCQRCEGEVCALRWPHLRPGGGVPFEARPLKAGVFLFRLLAASTRLIVKDLELPSTDAHTQDGPPLHATTTGCVTLQAKYLVTDFVDSRQENWRNYFKVTMEHDNCLW